MKTPPAITPLQHALRHWLQAYITTHGLKQNWICFAARISTNRVCDILKGREGMSLRNLERLATLFALRPSAILAEAEALIPQP